MNGMCSPINAFGPAGRLKSLALLKCSMFVFETMSFKKQLFSSYVSFFSLLLNFKTLNTKSSIING